MPLTRGVQLTTNTFRMSLEVAPSLFALPPLLLLLLKVKGRLVPAADGRELTEESLDRARPFILSLPLNADASTFD